nr:hypothetical protein [Tanacetum cinerariifolium]
MQSSAIKASDVVVCFFCGSADWCKRWFMLSVTTNRIPNDDEYGDDQDGNDEDGNGNNKPSSLSDDE